MLAPSARILAGVISDEEAAKIRRKLDEGWRGPVLLTWLRRLLDDREERVRRKRERGWGTRRPDQAPLWNIVLPADGGPMRFFLARPLTSTTRIARGARCDR